MAFSITYTSVVWTAGDVITEAKLDNMVANDQAYDAHESQGISIATIATPSNPASGKVRMYPKSDGYYYSLDSSGVESMVSTPKNGWYTDTNTWTYATAASPLFTLTVNADLTGHLKAGDRVKLTQSTGGTKYFIILKDPTYSAPNTTITIYGGTDYTLNNEAITSPFFSHMKSPAGMPMDPAKWTITTSDTTNRTQSTPTLGTWYNLGSLSISIPIGAWEVSYQVTHRVDDSSVTGVNIQSTLSTANNTGSDADFHTYDGQDGASANQTCRRTVYREKILVLAATTTYYLNATTPNSGINTIAHDGSDNKTIIRAISAFL